MKLRNKQIRSLALAMALVGGLGIGGCSANTDDGKSSVESSDAKDKDPTEHNENAQGNPRTDTTTTENMEKTYDKTNGARDINADGKADKPGTTSEHTTPEDEQRRQ